MSDEIFAGDTLGDGQVAGDGVHHHVVPLALRVVHQAGAAGVAEVDRDRAVAGEDRRNEARNLQDVARVGIGRRVTDRQLAMHGGGEAQRDVAARALDDGGLATGGFADVRGFGGGVGRLPDRRAAVGEAVGEEVQEIVAGARRVTQAGE